MIKAGYLSPKNMSKRQRRSLILQQVKFPDYLLRELRKNRTEGQREFNTTVGKMIAGKVPLDLQLVEQLKEKVAAERYDPEIIKAEMANG